LFTVPSAFVKILDRDLVAAGIATLEKRKNGKLYVAKRDDRGLSIDVHALRHTFNSLLAAADVSLRVRQILMRHVSSGTLTDDVYSDAKLLDLWGALDKLPTLILKPLGSGQPLRKTGTPDTPTVCTPVCHADGNF